VEDADRRNSVFKLSSGSTREYCFGYRVSEVPQLQSFLAVEPGSQIKAHSPSDKTFRRPVLVSLGCQVKNASPPHVDPDDSETVISGIKKRLVVSMPVMKPEYREAFRGFVRNYIEKHYQPLCASTDFSIDSWLDATHYPLYRKDQLKKKNGMILDPHESRYLKVKSFIKDETYTDFKHARTINSRTDEFKTLIGPYIKRVEQVVMHTDEFIKFVPCSQRPKYILDRFHGKYKHYYSTDFTSFEAHFVDLIEDTEFMLYQHMFKNIPEKEKVMRLLRESLLTWNHCTFKVATVKVWRRRMSGEMSTSLGNGFANLMIIKFLCSLLGQEVDPVVEGDDGLFGLNVEIQTPDWIKENLGFLLKIEESATVAESSFCGNIFDEQDLLIVTDPAKVLVNFGWTNSRYAASSDKRMKQLLRSKALSLAWSYPGCPILQSLANYGLRVTSGTRARGFFHNEYEREFYALNIKNHQGENAPNIEPPNRTRELVERLFAITIPDQKIVERYLDSLQTIQPLSHPVIDRIMDPKWQRYNSTYKARLPIHGKLTTYFPAEAQLMPF